MSDNKVEVSDDNMGHRWYRQSREKEEDKASHHKNLPVKSFSRTKKPHRKSVNLKDHDQLGKRNVGREGIRGNGSSRRPIYTESAD